MRLAVATTLVAAALLPAAPAASAAEPIKRCGFVGFTPQSDDVAAGIRAAGVSCRFARKLVRDSEGRPPRSYRGFTCTRRLVDREDALTHTRYRCTSGTKLIRWNRF